MLSLAAAAGFAQTATDVVLHQQFQGDADGWTVSGTDAEVRAEAPAANQPGSAGKLIFSYELSPGKHSGAVLPAPQGFARAQRIRFRIKSDRATAMGLLLSEKKPGGGNYAAWFWLPADEWQQVELTPADFTATDGPGDPVDQDGKLDMDAVEGIGLFDLTQFFAALPAAADIPVVVNQASGKRTVAMEDFEVLSSPAPAPAGAGSGAALESFDRDFLDWVTLGGMDLKLSAAGNPLGERAMEAAYRQVDGQLEVLMRRVSGAGAANSKRLEFDIASERETTLVVSIEMKKPGGGQGPRFTLPIYPPGGKEVFHVDLKLADFEGHGQFDPAQWRSLAIADVTTAGGGQAGANRLWIGNVRAVE
jgi:hypothetical protein